MKELALALWAKTLNVPIEVISENIFKKSADGTLTDELLPTASDFLENKYAQHISTIAKPVDEKALLAQGRQNGYAEASEKWEKSFKSKIGLVSDKKGEDLQIEGISHLSKSSEQDENKIKTHPIFLQLESKLLNDKEAAIAAVRGELEGKLSELNRNTVLSSVKGRANQFLNGLKPVLPSEKHKAEFQIQAFNQQFENFDYEEVGGEVIMKKLDGTRYENKLGYPVKFDDFVKEKADLIFTFEKQDGKQSPANTGQSGTGQSAVTMPKTKDEYYTMLNDRNVTGEQKRAIMDLGEPKE